MRRFPTGVAVATVAVGEQRLGLTIGSLVSLSLEPPLVGMSVGHQSSAHELVREAEAFAVSILSEDQVGLAQHFARGTPPIVMWTGVETREGVTGAPLLEGALAWLEARKWAEHEAGDHTFFIGEVVATELGRSGQGLVYRESGYHPA